MHTTWHIYFTIIDPITVTLWTIPITNLIIYFNHCSTVQSKCPMWHSILPFRWKGFKIKGTALFILPILINNLSSRSSNTWLHTGQLQNWLIYHPSYWVHKNNPYIILSVSLNTEKYQPVYSTTHWLRGISCSVYAWSLLLTVSFRCVG